MITPACKRTEPAHGGCSNPAFKYTPAVATDLRKTFRRIQKQQRLAAQEKEPK